MIFSCVLSGIFWLIRDKNAITSHISFDEIPPFYEQILRVKDVDHCVAVLVGNKHDLLAEAQVSKEEGQAYADSLGCPFFETSAKTGENVEEAFLTLARCLLNEDKTKPGNYNDNTESDHKGKCIIC